jgi:lactoylglutathione lyase
MQYLHTMLRVGNLEQSLDFFCNKLGLAEIRRRDYAQGRYTLVFLAAPDDVEAARTHKAPMIELTHNWDEAQYQGGRSFGHVAYAVDDIYALCTRLMESGVTIHRPPRDGHMAFIKTPDGISIELLQKGESLAPREPWKSMANTGSW